MKRKWNNVLSWLLTVVMVLTSFEGMSVPVFAAGNADGAESVSVQAISSDEANPFTAGDGKEATPYTLSVNKGTAVSVSFSSAVLSGNTVSSDKVSWNLVKKSGDDLGFTVTKDATDNNKCVVSSNGTTSGNAVYQLTASFNGADPAEQTAFIKVEVKEPAAPAPAPEPTVYGVKEISVSGASAAAEQIPSDHESGRDL